MKKDEVEARISLILGESVEALGEPLKLGDAGWDSLATIELMAWLGPSAGPGAKDLQPEGLTLNQTVVAILELFDDN